MPKFFDCRFSVCTPSGRIGPPLYSGQELCALKRSVQLRVYRNKSAPAALRPDQQESTDVLGTAYFHFRRSTNYTSISYLRQRLSLHTATFKCPGFSIKNSVGSFITMFEAEWDEPRQIRDADIVTLQPQTGSPLARSWGYPRIPPTVRYDMSDINTLRRFDSNEPYWILTHALAKIHKHATTFQTHCRITATVFSLARQLESSLCERHVPEAFKGLETLKLSLRYTDDDDYDSLEEITEIDGICESMEFLSGLKILDLELPDGDIHDPDSWMQCNLVFPQPAAWTLLRTLKLQHLAVGAKEFISLLVMRMPSLQHLSIGHIFLHNGEILRITNWLSSFTIIPKSRLCGSSIPPRELGFVSDRFSIAVAEYVIDWPNHLLLWHPCLRSDQTLKDSFNVMTDMIGQWNVVRGNNRTSELVTMLKACGERYQRERDLYMRHHEDT